MEYSNSRRSQPPRSTGRRTLKVTLGEVEVIEHMKECSPSLDVAQKYMDLARWYMMLALYGGLIASLHNGSCLVIRNPGDSIAQLSFHGFGINTTL